MMPLGMPSATRPSGVTPPVSANPVAFGTRKKEDDAEQPKRRRQEPLPETPRMESWGRSLFIDVVDGIPIVGDYFSWRRTSKLIKYARKQGVDERYVKNMKRVRWADIGLSILGLTAVGKGLDLAFPSNTINQGILKKGLEARDAGLEQEQAPPQEGTRELPRRKDDEPDDKDSIF